jgi:hypothetical protein
MTTIKRLTILAALALLVLPAAALGSTPSKAASASCKAQLSAMGATNFNAKYHTFGGCVSQTQKLTPAQRQSLLSAEKTCRAEQLSLGDTAFTAKYGSNNKSGKHASAPTAGTAADAFGKCVSTHNHT